MDNTLATQPSGIRNIVSPTTGQVRGTQFLFACEHTPLELKEKLKGTGLSNTQVSKRIREIRRGSESLAWVEAGVFMEAMRAKGAIPVSAKDLKNTASLSFIKLKEEKVEAPVDRDAVLNTAATNLMNKIGCTMEEAMDYLK